MTAGRHACFKARPNGPSPRSVTALLAADAAFVSALTPWVYN